MGIFITFGPGEVAAAAVVFPLVCSVLVALRFLCRQQKKMRIGVDDWLLVFALALIIAMGCLSIYGIAVRAEGYLTPEDEVEAMNTDVAISKVFWNTEWMQALALGCIKLSFVFFYRRIFSVQTNRRGAFNIASLVTIGIILIWTVGCFLAMMLMCPGHVDAYWSEDDDAAGLCWDATSFLLAYAWSDAGTDLLVLLLPMPSIFKLKMTFHRKLAVAAIFLLGTITFAASTIRAALYVYLLAYDNAADKDPNMLNTNGIYWMLVETGLAMITVNLPVLYGGTIRENFESVLRSVRSFVSLPSSKASAPASTTSQSTESVNVEPKGV